MFRKKDKDKKKKDKDEDIRMSQSMPVESSGMLSRGGGAGDFDLSKKDDELLQLEQRKQQEEAERRRLQEAEQRKREQAERERMAEEERKQREKELELQRQREEAQRAAEKENEEEEEYQRKMLAARKRRTFSFFNKDEAFELEKAGSGRRRSAPPPQFATPVDSDQPHKSKFKLDDLFVPEVYRSFHNLTNMAREYNVEVSVPEFVVVGAAGKGKSSVVEALLGFACNCVPTELSLTEATTKRILYISLINNPQKETPSFSIRKSQYSAAQTTVPITQLGAELNRLMSSTAASPSSAPSTPTRNSGGIDSMEPIFLNIEYSECISMNIIDTPPLPHKSAALDARVAALLKDSTKRILFVEEALEWSESNGKAVSIARKFDPMLSRTTFVFTKFHSLLRSFNSAEKLNKFLKSLPRDAHWYCMSLFSAKIREQCIDDSAKFDKRITQSQERDEAMLEMLQCEKQFKEQIGTLKLRAFAWRSAWTSYKALLPHILTRIRVLIADSQKQLIAISDHKTDAITLRTTASKHAVQFLQTIGDIVRGTAEAEPSVIGQTLTEEKQFIGEYMDESYNEVHIDPQNGAIPFYHCKLYGGQQFNRMMDEFKAVVQQTEISDRVSIDDIANASGLQKLGGSRPNFFSVASDIAQQKTRETLQPIIEQAVRRASHIIKQMTEVEHTIRTKKIAFNEARTKARSSRGGPQTSDLFRELPPYLATRLKHTFDDVVDRVSRDLLQSCFEELKYANTAVSMMDLDSSNVLSALATSAISPSASSGSLSALANGASTTDEDASVVVMKHLKTVFHSLRERILHNVSLKFHNAFFVVFTREVWKEVNRSVTALTDEDLEETFQMPLVLENMEKQQKELEDKLDAYHADERAYLRDATVFCHSKVLHTLKSTNQKQTKQPTSEEAPKKSSMASAHTAKKAVSVSFQETKVAAAEPKPTAAPTSTANPSTVKKTALNNNFSNQKLGEFVARLRANDATLTAFSASTDASADISTLTDSELADFCVALANSTKLKSIDLSACGIKSKREAEAVVGAITVNTSLTHVCLASNSFNDAANDSVKKLILENSIVQSLDLRGNAFGDAGINAICTALYYNKTLTSLQVSFASADDLDEIEEMLSRNASEQQRK